MNFKNKSFNLIYSYLIVFFISVSVLMFEILSTRIAKISFGYNFQFIILSLAVLGIGLGGVFVFYFFSYLKKNRIIKLIIISILYLFFLIFSFLINNYFYILNIFFTKIVFFLFILITYFLSGIILSVLFTFFKEKSSILYFFSMIGSAFGSFLIIFFLNHFGNEITIIILIIISSSIILFFMMENNVKKIYYVFFILVLILTCLFISNYVKIKCLSIEESFMSGKDYESKEFLFSKSNSMSYLEVYKDGNFKYKFVIDCIGDTTAIDLGSVNHSAYINNFSKDISFFPFIFKNYNSTLVLGSGGGMEVINAENSSKNITAIEINYMTISSLNNIISKENNIYNGNNVNLKIEEARSFVSVDENKYDLIHISATKRYGGVGVKEFIFLENYLYSKEAINDYLASLNDEGFIFIKDLDIFTEKYASTIIVTLLENGYNPENSMIILDSNGQNSAILIKKGNFTNQEKEIILNLANKNNFELYYLNSKDIQKIEKTKIITDDNPFYWNAESLKFSSLTIYNSNYNNYPHSPKQIDSSLEKDQRFTEIKNIYLLFYILLGIFIFLFLLPFFKKDKISKTKLFYQLSYFSLIGIGFIIFQLLFIHKFTLFLVNPVYAISIILSTLLFFGGIGSLITNKFKDENLLKHVKKIIFFLSLYMIIFIVSFDFIYQNLLHSSIYLKIITAVLLILIPSTLIGMLFPIGLRITNSNFYRYIPYMWGINGIASVLGSVIAMIFLLHFGINVTFIIGIIFYISSLIIIKT